MIPYLQSLSSPPVEQKPGLIRALAACWEGGFGAQRLCCKSPERTHSSRSGKKITRFLAKAVGCLWMTTEKVIYTEMHRHVNIKNITAIIVWSLQKRVIFHFSLHFLTVPST